MRRRWDWVSLLGFFAWIWEWVKYGWARERGGGEILQGYYFLHL